jgi:hypothetical protein
MEDFYLLEYNAVFPFHSSMALQPFVGPLPLLQFRNVLTQTVGLLGRGSARRKAATYIQDNTNTQ